MRCTHATLTSQRTPRRVTPCLIATVICVMTGMFALDARAEDIETQVKAVASGGVVTLSLPRGHKVRPGDDVVIRTRVPGLGDVELATRWTIDIVDAEEATASPGSATTVQLQPGFTAIVKVRGDTVQSSAGELAPDGRAQMVERKSASSDERSLRERAESGDVEAMRTIAMLLLRISPVQADEADASHKEGVSWLQRAAETGNAAAACELSWHYAQEKNDGDSVRWMQAAAEAGATSCMHAFGMRLLYGNGIPKDARAGFGFLAKASEAGVVAATYELAHLHLSGIGTSMDARKAMQLFTRAAERGNPAAMFYAGALRMERSAEAIEGVRWLTSAAMQGQALADHFLAYAHIAGLGVPKDPRKAWAHASKAAERGIGDAMLLMARLREMGVGIEQESREAARLAIEGIRAGSLDAEYLMVERDKWSKTFWAALQSRLKDAGLYNGVSDGEFGPDLVKAIALAMKSAKR